jgi:ribosomal protein S21
MNGKKYYKDRGYPPPFEFMLRKFKKYTEDNGVLKELKKREFFETKGQKERRKLKEGRRRHEKIMMEQENVRQSFRQRRY